MRRIKDLNKLLDDAVDKSTSREPGAGTWIELSRGGGTALGPGFRPWCGTLRGAPLAVSYAAATEPLLRTGFLA